MKSFTNCLISFLLLLSGSLFSQIERVLVETYYISDVYDSTDTDGGKLDTASVTYRIYVDLKPGNRLVEIYGDANHTIKFSSTAPFFNNIDGDTYGKDLRKGKYFNDTYALDTYLTLGQTSRPAGGITQFGILKRQDRDGSFVGGANNNGGSAAIPEGLLSNTIAALGIPLITADGMDTMTNVPSKWADYGIKDFLSQIDTTMFGSTKVNSDFTSNNMFLRNSGVTGVLPDSNQVLVAQLTTKGQLSFELNVKVEEVTGIDTVIVSYVANDSILLPGEKKNSFLKYPFAAAQCGCKDPNYLEYNPNFECADSAYCLNLIVFGCMDTMACNYDRHANFSTKSLCCYPGSCGGRDISVVCPSVMGNGFVFDIYPNPSESSIYLNVTVGSKQVVSYSIYNSFGTEVLHENLGEIERLNDYEINLESLSSGLYLVQIKTDETTSSKQFFRY